MCAVLSQNGKQISFNFRHKGAISSAEKSLNKLI